MTESDWLSSTDPGTMLAYVVRNASPRKLRLFASAALGEVWDEVRDGRSRRAVEVSELFADGKATDKKRENAWAEAVEASEDAPWNATRTASVAALTLLFDLPR